jgi:CRP/FNR family transcriptional regulator, cyclic AMP receptor protein
VPASLTVFDRLALHPVVAGMPAGWLHELAACGRPVGWPAGTRLLREGSPVDQLWLLWSGAVVVDWHVPGRGDIPIDHIGPGGVLGWSCLLPPFRSGTGALAVAECRAVALRTVALRELIGGNPALGAELTRRMLAVATGQLRAARIRAAGIGSGPSDRDQRP